MPVIVNSTTGIFMSIVSDLLLHDICHHCDFYTTVFFTAARFPKK